jgi:hypothetical protein
MARHAGFSLAVSVSQTVANEFLLVFFANAVPPQSFSLPPTVTIGGTVVTLSGTVALLPPEVTFARNPANAVGVSMAVMGRVGFSACGLPAQSYDVILYATVSVPIASANNGSLLFPGINLAQVVITALGVEVLRNPQSFSGPIQPVYQQALTSSPVIGAINAGLQSFAPLLLPLGPFRFPSIFHKDIHRPPPKGTSEFGPFPVWFTIDIRPTRLAAVVLDGAVSLGVDLNGATFGDPAQLVDLNTDFAPGSYVYTLSPSGSSFGGTPSGPRNSAVGAAVNPAFVQSLLSQQVVPRLVGTLIDDHVEITGLDIAFGFFDAGIQGTGFGATLTAQTTYHASTHRAADGFGYFVADSGSLSVDATATFHLEYVLNTRDGPTSFVAGSVDRWGFRVVDATVSISPLLDALLVLGVIAVPALILPVGTLSLIAGLVTQAELNSVLDNAAFQAGAGAGAALQDGTVVAQQTMPFPDTPAPPWLTIVNGAALGEQGFDANLKVAPTAWPTLVVTQAPNSVLDPSPIVVTLALPPGLYNAQDPSLFATWKVQRTDTMAVLFNPAPTQQLAAVGGVASTTINHTDPAIADAPGFLVSCRCVRLLGYRVDTVFTGQIAVSVPDAFDRHHPYVHWNHQAFFPAPGPPPPPGKHQPYWGRSRISAIHRTEPRVRCLEMRRRTLPDPRIKSVGYQYLDALPPGLGAHGRNGPRVCQYCFYGGPTKSTLLP